MLDEVDPMLGAPWGMVGPFNFMSPKQQIDN